MFLTILALCAAQHSFELPGASHWDGMGMSTFIMDDLNGDGLAEIGTSAFCTDFNGTNSGSVYVFDGATLTQLRRHDGVGASSRLGRFSTSIGDIDGDGVRDYAAGATFESTYNHLGGALYVWSGATGQQLAWIGGHENTGRLGAAISGIGDLDNDGTPDLLVGAPGEANGDGRVYAFSGATGAEINHFNGRSSNGGCGTSVAAIGDIDGDGVEDFAIGEPFARTGQGDVHLVSGATFNRIRRIKGNTTDAWFGFRVAHVGAANNDSRDEILIGEPCKDTVHVYNTRGIRLRKHEGPGSQSGPKQGWGHSVAGAGDVDGDGYDDYVIGAPGEWVGFSFLNAGANTIIFSGNTGAQIMSFSPAEGDDSFGSSIAVGIAITSTGQKALLVGAPAAGSISGHHATGMVCGFLLP